MKISKCCREEVNTIRGVCGGFTNYCKRCGKLCDTIETKEEKEKVKDKSFNSDYYKGYIQGQNKGYIQGQRDASKGKWWIEKKDNLHSKCCEGTNEAQAEIINAYERGFIEGANLTGSQAKEELEEQKIDILEKYNKFLIKNNYADDDLWNEEPTAIERFLNNK